MFWEHRVRVNAGGKDRVIVIAKLGVLAVVCVLVTRPPVVEFPSTDGALEGFGVVFDIKVDTRIDHFGDESVVIVARNLI